MSEFKFKIGDRVRSYDFGKEASDDCYYQGVIVELNTEPPSKCCKAHFKAFIDYKMFNGVKKDLKGDEFFWGPMYNSFMGLEKTYVEKPLEKIVI